MTCTMAGQPAQLGVETANQPPVVPPHSHPGPDWPLYPYWGQGWPDNLPHPSPWQAQPQSAPIKVGCTPSVHNRAPRL